MHSVEINTAVQLPSWPQPSHPNLIKVVSDSPDFSTFAAYSLVDLPPGAVVTRIENPVPNARKAYSSVQVARNGHIELMSDLLYCNHSCKPTVVFDMAAFEVRVAERPLKAGDPLTFFYPSTEWEMAQPFDCNCGTSACKGWIAGASQMDEAILQGYWLNDHIVQLLAERKSKHHGANGNVRQGPTSRELSGEMGGDTC